MRSPVNAPSTRGARNGPVRTPSNVPAPATGIARVLAPKALIIPASRRSLSCQSRLVTWKRSVARSPQAVRPSKETNVRRVASELGPIVDPLGTERVGERPADGGVADGRTRIEGPRLGPERGELRGEVGAARRGVMRREPAGGLAVSQPDPRLLGEASERLLEDRPAVSRPGEAEAARFEEVGQRGETHASIGGVEPAMAGVFAPSGIIE